MILNLITSAKSPCYIRSINTDSGDGSRDVFKDFSINQPSTVLRENLADARFILSSSIYLSGASGRHLALVPPPTHGGQRILPCPAGLAVVWDLFLSMEAKQKIHRT